MPATFGPLDFLTASALGVDDAVESAFAAGIVTTTVWPGATLVTTDGAAVVVFAEAVVVAGVEEVDAADVVLATDDVVLDVDDDDDVDDDASMAWTLLSEPVRYIDQ